MREMNGVNNCVMRWPKKEQSFRECFGDCYKYLYLGLSPFYQVEEKVASKNIWVEIFQSGRPVKWKDVGEKAGLTKVNEINKALSNFGDEERNSYLDKLKNYIDTSLVYYPLYDDLDPFILIRVFSVLRSHGFFEICLSSLDIEETHNVAEFIYVNDIKPVKGTPLNPMRMYTPNKEFLCSTYFDYPCFLLAAESKLLLDKVVKECEIEGFYLQDEGLDW